MRAIGSLADADLSYATLETRDEAEWRTEIGWPIFRADAGGGTRAG